MILLVWYASSRQVFLYIPQDFHTPWPSQQIETQHYLPSKWVSIVTIMTQKLWLINFKSYLLLIADLDLHDPNFESFDFLLAIVSDFVERCPSLNEIIGPKMSFIRNMLRKSSSTWSRSSYDIILYDSYMSNDMNHMVFYEIRPLINSWLTLILTFLKYGMSRWIRRKDLKCFVFLIIQHLVFLPMK